MPGLLTLTSPPNPMSLSLSVKTTAPSTPVNEAMNRAGSREGSSKATTSRAEVFAVLAERPIIELAGLRLTASGERVFQELSSERASHLELGVLHAHALHRLPEGAAMPLRGLLEGFRTRDGARVLIALRAAHDQMRR